MNNIGKRLMPIYLIKFLEENYFDIIPENFGKRMVSRQFIAEIKALYDEFDGKPIDNYGRRMVPEYLIKAFSDIEYIEYTDDDVKYEKTVPTGALKYATLDMLGGMSYKCNNLCPTATYDDVMNNTIAKSIDLGNLPNGTYTISFNVLVNADNRTFIIYYVDNGVVNTTDIINTNLNGTGQKSYTFTISNSITYDDIIFGINSGSNDYAIQLENLMLNTGSTALPYEPYFTGIRDSAVKSVVAKKTYEIDEHIQALTGYGQSNPDDSTKYNYIDFESKKFIEVGYIDNEEWVQLETPVETDISDYIKDNFIEVEPTGSVTFTNEYEQAVPSEVTYLIKE